MLPEFRSREINELARHFKRMVGAIREREHKLVSGERKYREIFNATNEAIFVHDAETGELVDVNETMLEMFCCTHEEALGVGVVQFSGEYDYDVSEEILERIRSAAKGMPQVFEWRCKRQDGGYFTAEVTLKAVDIDEQLRVLAVVRDITDRKRAQEALRVLNMELEARVDQRTAELTAANKAKTEFLSKMSHELRTPLNAVIGLSEMLLEDAQEDREDHLVEPLQRILGAGQHLLVLINDILDLAKIESGHMELHLEQVTFDEMIDGVVSTIGPLVAQNNNSFELKLADSDTETLTDVTKVRQILFNLLSNASKFTEDGSIRLEIHAADNWVNFAVIDSGVGIPRDFLPHLFEEFMQSGAHAGHRQEGTGLGLPICQRLCDIMGGDIYAESEEGVGSTFYVRLPLKVVERRIQPRLSGAESKRA